MSKTVYGRMHPYILFVHHLRVHLITILFNWITQDDHNAAGNPSRPAHVLLVADPQIVDLHSYPSRGPVLSYMTRVLVDLNLRKSWRVALQKRPDAIVFLGDMMDNGRYDMPDPEWALSVTTSNSFIKWRLVMRQIRRILSEISEHFLFRRHSTILHSRKPRYRVSILHIFNYRHRWQSQTWECLSIFHSCSFAIHQTLWRSQPRNFNSES